MSSVVTTCSWYKWNLALVHYKIEKIKLSLSFLVLRMCYEYITVTAIYIFF